MFGNECENIDLIWSLLYFFCFYFRSDYALFQKILKLEFEYPANFPADAKDFISKLLVNTCFMKLTLIVVIIKFISLFSKTD